MRDSFSLKLDFLIVLSEKNALLVISDKFIILVSFLELYCRIHRQKNLPRYSFKMATKLTLKFIFS